MEEKAAPHDRLFAIPAENLRAISESIFTKLNKFLRSQSALDGNLDDGLIHEHTLRHACQCWGFAAAMIREGHISRPLFPDLEETSQWLARCQQVSQILGHNRPTGKQAFMLASLAGHADFLKTTARTYIHTFPWLLAAFLDESKLMRPGESPVKRASGRLESTPRTWREVGIHQIAVRLLKERYKDNRIFIPPTETTNLRPRPVLSLLASAWNTLWAQATLPSTLEPDDRIRGMLVRVEALWKMTVADGTYRHRMATWIKDRSVPGGEQRIFCPRKPIGEKDVCLSKLWNRIEKLESTQPSLVQDAARIYTHHLEKSAWIRFDAPARAEDAKRYLHFLYALDLGPKQIRAVSGDPDPNSGWRAEWVQQLAHFSPAVKSARPSPYLGLQSAISIRPHPDSLNTGHGGFRFAMVMAYIIFGGDGGQAIVS